MYVLGTERAYVSDALIVSHNQDHVRLQPICEDDVRRNRSDGEKDRYRNQL